MSNTYDPVTPLYAGVQMAKKFVNAEKSMGHCTLAATSLCTIAKIKAYLTKGEVPPPPKEGGKGRELEDGEWVRCEAEEWPFHWGTSEEFIAMNSVEITEELEAVEAWKEMQRIFSEMKHWGQPMAVQHAASKASYVESGSTEKGFEGGDLFSLS